MQIAGVYFEDDEAVRAAAARQLRGSAVWSSRDDYHVLDGLVRAIEEAGEHRPALAAAVSEALASDDPQVRTGAVRVLVHVADLVGAPRLRSLLEDRPELYQDVEGVGYRMSEPLEAPMLRALAATSEPGDPAATRLVQGGLKRGLMLYKEAARVAPSWVLDHTPGEFGRDVLGAVLKGLPTPAQREAWVRAAGPWPEAEREEAADHWVWNTLDLPDAEVAHLKAIVRGEA